VLVPQTKKEATAMHKRFLISSILVVLVSAAIAQTALAAGEPKNQSPFIRQVTVVPIDESDVVSRYLASRHALTYVQAEAKNEPPFTRQVAVPTDNSDVVSRYLARTQGSQAIERATTRSSRGGFDWTLAGIAATLVAIGTGIALRLRRIQQHKVPQAA
jgi:hypothetical protein